LQLQIATNVAASAHQHRVRRYQAAHTTVDELV